MPGLDNFRGGRASRIRDGIVGLGLDLGIVRPGPWVNSRDIDMPVLLVGLRP